MNNIKLLIFVVLFPFLLSCSEEPGDVEPDEDNEYIELLTSKTWELEKIGVTFSVSSNCNSTFDYEYAFGDLVFEENGSFEYSFTFREDSYSKSGSYQVEDDKLLTNTPIFKEAECFEKVEFYQNINGKYEYTVRENLRLTGLGKSEVMEIYLK